MIRQLMLIVCGLAALCAAPAVSAQVPFEDVVRNLRNPDPKIRLNAVRLLREAKYAEAITPLAALVNDPVDDIQLEAIGAELSFYLVEDVPAKKRIAFVVEVRTGGRAQTAFEMGPLAAWPRPVPAELTSALLQGVDDENQRVRLEAIYTLGTIARPPLAAEHAERLIKALDHYDPAVRAAAARVAGRLRLSTAGDALIRAMNDSSEQVRFASMRALGEIGEPRAVQALTEQLAFYEKGEGAWAALDALARIAHPTSVPLFKARLAARDPNLRRAAMEGLGRTADRSELSALEIAANNDSAEMGRAAAVYALQKLGRHNIPRLVEFMDSPQMTAQVGGYLLELGPTVVKALVPHLLDQDAAIRASVAEVLGAIGGAEALAALKPLLQDRDRSVVQAATRALERASMKR